MNTQTLETQQVTQVIEKVILQVYKKSPSVHEMASMAGMSISKFRIVSKNEYGKSPHQHILEGKLMLARDLLQTGRYSVSQAAYKVGFNHPSGFIRLFKHKFECSPSELISNH